MVKIDGGADTTGLLKKSANLSDLTDVGTARTNLGLGSAAVEDASAFDAAGGGAATLTNGAASAAQKIVTVDSTAGFFAGVGVSYFLAGGSLETNTIDTIDSGTQMTLTTNIGSGGIADNEVVAQVTPLEQSLGTAAFESIGTFEALDLTLAKMMDARNSYLNIFDQFDKNKPQRPVSIQYSSATLYYFWQYISGAYWGRWKLTKNTSGVWFLGNNLDIYTLYDATNDDDSGITYDASVATWATSATSSNVGGSSHYAYQPLMWMEFEITGYRELWIAYNEYSTGGYVVPTIDGAQTLVDKRMLEYEAVQGEWVWNTYGASTTYNNWIRIAAGLNPDQTYTIRLTTSAETASPGGNRFYFEAYGNPAARADSPKILTNASNQVVLQAFEFDAGAGFAINPSGGGVELSGDGHNNESVISVSFVDADGNNCEPTSSIAYQTVNEFSIVQSSYMRHSSTGSTNLAQHTKILQFTSEAVRQSVKTTWLAASVLVDYYYVGLVRATGDFGALAGDTTIYNPVAGGNTRYGNIKSLAGMLWSSANDFVILASLENPQQHSNFNNGGYTFIEDRTTGNKLYFRPQDDNVTPSVNDVWYFSHGWRLARIPQIESYI